MGKKVAYFYDADVGSFSYGGEHPMKPFRIKMAHELILRYELYRKMDVYQPNKASD
jgi:acetoin utilization deacetylase AcuC-like enzyme